MSTDPIDRLRPKPPHLGDGPGPRDVEARPATLVHTSLHLRQVGGEGHAVRYRTLRFVEFGVPAKYGLPPQLEQFVVSEGFVFDKATMPRVARVAGSVVGLDRDHLDAASLAHDWALANRARLGVSRRDCDRLFLAVALAEPHLPDWQARAAFLAVRANSLLSAASGANH